MDTPANVSIGFFLHHELKQFKLNTFNAVYFIAATKA